MFLLEEDGVRERSRLVEDGDMGGGIFANRDMRIAQGIAVAVALDLVDDLLELQGQVFGKQARLLPGEDQVEVLRLGERPVSIIGTARRNGKTSVEGLDKVGQVGIGLLEGGKALQAHFLHQAVLQGLVDPLDASFSLGRIRT